MMVNVFYLLKCKIMPPALKTHRSTVKLFTHVAKVPNNYILRNREIYK